MTTLPFHVALVLGRFTVDDAAAVHSQEDPAEYARACGDRLHAVLMPIIR